MMRTEEDAKSRQCPMFRYCINEFSVSADGHAAIEAHAQCRASECIMWRWAQDPMTEYCPAYGKTISQRKDDEGEYISAEHPAGNGWTAVSVETWSNKLGRPRSHVMHWERKIRVGYCGLAGKPIA